MSELSQYFFNDKHFNFKWNGLSSTTWTWEDLERAHPNGLMLFDNWLVIPKTREAFEVKRAIGLK